MADFLIDSDVQPDPERPGRYTLDLSPAWNVFYAFGGMTMACALRALVREVARDDLTLLTANALFIQPVTAGPVEIDVRVLRDGRRAAQAVADLRNAHHDGSALHVTAALGHRYPDGFGYLDARFPDVPPPEACAPVPPPAQDSAFAELAFDRQIEWRMPRPWRVDDASWTPQPATFANWMRFRTEPRLPDGTIDPIALAIPADVLGPAIAQQVGPEPFLVLSLEIGLQVYRPTTSGWFLQHVRAPVAADGYGAGTVELWDTDRQLVAFATQRARLRPITPGEHLGPPR